MRVNFDNDDAEAKTFFSVVFFIVGERLAAACNLEFFFFDNAAVAVDELATAFNFRKSLVMDAPQLTTADNILRGAFLNDAAAELVAANTFV